jgi:short-subunit dehydrogenase
MHNTVYTLITGASEGLGKAFAFECASRAMNLILVSLPESGLPELANFIRRNFDISVHYFEKDLSQSSGCYDVFLEIENKKLQVNILINNAGMGSTILFDEGSPEFYEKQIGLNVLATTVITHLFIKNLRGKTPAYVLNVGSMASFFFLPKKQVYGGTKSYIYYFSKSLKKELKNKGVNVSVLCPGGINTNLSVTLSNKNASWTSRISIMNPEEVAPIALNGLLKKKEVIIPGRLNRFFLFLDKILPAPVKTLITNYTMKKINPPKWYNHYLLKPVSSPAA